jgi:hypothetical protein
VPKLFYSEVQNEVFYIEGIYLDVIPAFSIQIKHATKRLVNYFPAQSVENGGKLTYGAEELFILPIHR